MKNVAFGQYRRSVEKRTREYIKFLTCTSEGDIGRIADVCAHQLQSLRVSGQTHELQGGINHVKRAVVLDRKIHVAADLDRILSQQTLSCRSPGLRRRLARPET